MKNTHVTPSKAKGVGAQGNPAPLVNMPANNVGMFPVKLGSGQASKFGQGVNSKAGNSPASQSGSGKHNLPAHNNGKANVPLGTTKHGVGEVPGYLKGKSK